MCCCPEPTAATPPAAPPARAGRRARGFSLVELLAAVAIGMTVLAAVSTMLIRHEGARRGAAATTDAALGSSWLAYTLDRAIRSAGSGFVHDRDEAYGCALHAARDGVAMLPRPQPFPAPFAGVPGTYRLAPVLAYPGEGAGGSDVLAIATGHASLGARGMRVQPSPITDTSIPLKSTLSLSANELLLVVQSGRPCMLQQIEGGFVPGAVQNAALGGRYAAGSIGGVALTDYGLDSSPFVVPLGRPGRNPPALQLIGIGADATLFALDLLGLDGGDAPVALESGVVDLRVRYGVDTDGTPGIDRWVAPAAPDYRPAALTGGSPAAVDRLRGIRAIRIGLVLRDAQLERDAVAPASLTLFADLPDTEPVTVTLDEPARRMRHRTLEFTVPLRNVLLDPL
jgi:type IV pilus assembly protein PilW